MRRMLRPPFRGRTRDHSPQTISFSSLSNFVSRGGSYCTAASFFSPRGPLGVVDRRFAFCSAMHSVYPAVPQQ